MCISSVIIVICWINLKGIIQFSKHSRLCFGQFRLLYSRCARQFKKTHTAFECFTWKRHEKPNISSNDRVIFSSFSIFSELRTKIAYDVLECRQSLLAGLSICTEIFHITLFFAILLLIHPFIKTCVACPVCSFDLEPFNRNQVLWRNSEHVRSFFHSFSL